MLSKEEVLVALEQDDYSRMLVETLITMLVAIESCDKESAFLDLMYGKIDTILTDLHIPELRQEQKIDF